MSKPLVNQAEFLDGDDGPQAQNDQAHEFDAEGDPVHDLLLLSANGCGQDKSCPYNSRRMEFSAAEYRRARREHWDEVARRFDAGSRLGGYYHRRLSEVYRQIAAPG